MGKQNLSKNRISVGIDLGGTRIKLGLLNCGRLVAKKVFEAESDLGLQASLPKIDKNIEGLLNEHGFKKDDLLGIGLSFAGLVDSTRKRIISTNKKYDDGPELDLEDWVKQHWGCAFYIENDARMAAVGEWFYGAGRGSNDLVMVTIGTGIGSSAIIDGHLLRGKHFQAGCLGGHFTVQYDGNLCTCGNLGCVEAQASTWNIARMVQDHPDFRKSILAHFEKIDFQSVFDAALQKDALAVRVRQECLKIWSAGIINLIHAYDPELVILGGGILNSKDEILPFIKEQISKYAWCPWGSVELKVSELMDDAAILGVAHCLTNQI